VRVKMSVPRVGVSVKVSASVAVRSAAEALRETLANVTLSVIARLMDRPLAIDSAKWIASVTWRAVRTSVRATTRERDAVRDRPDAGGEPGDQFRERHESVTVRLIDRPLTSDSLNVTLSVAVLPGRLSVRASDSANVTLSVEARRMRRDAGQQFAERDRVGDRPRDRPAAEDGLAERDRVRRRPRRRDDPREALRERDRVGAGAGEAQRRPGEVLRERDRVGDRPGESALADGVLREGQRVRGAADARSSALSGSPTR
jgi:hypothetical protein